MLVIIDYGMGNLRSVYKAFKRIGAEVEISSSPETIAAADKLILPGVGYFKTGMQNLNERGLVQLLNQRVLIDKVPILGICLGMQLFTSHSEEGDAEGLNWIHAQTLKFDFSGTQNSLLKVPHIGWNSIAWNKPHFLLENINQNEHFYFVHSYYVKAKEQENVLCSTDYGITFHSALTKENITGVQFHPEKSHHMGMSLLKNFIEKS
ncbi:glutamine amidotransferase [Flavobacteriales bacterium]|nr:Imidazole glycerol phosphate synthase subunit HisH [Flavobacteriales bacterium]MCL4815979.1 imidazole glycerol phosphate synthase subunit HisH [Flavobacteriales bacterium]WKZ74309.1 MAG: imidazole glycerol phosphate synthase subunit HisH [Vicingaceae bacterium]GIK70627.1 MAG: imidazole glycerol phosphate synthase subunit HisH 2 [Bacteroidota bacterium]CAG0977817.1 glutamine amidotransferase [Flavobacteriales bacterium]